MAMRKTVRCCVPVVKGTFLLQQGDAITLKGLRVHLLIQELGNHRFTSLDAYIAGARELLVMLLKVSAPACNALLEAAMAKQKFRR